jgi:hypothetical protein
MQSLKALGVGLICAAISSAELAVAQPEEAQAEPKGYVCAFSSGTSSSYENGTFKVKPPVELKFEISDIDLDGQTAHLITNGQQKAGALKIVRAINANHFLEVVNEGFLNLTTVYDKDTAVGSHPAVHSRHLGVLGQPVFAQYAGFCTEK